MANAHGGEFTEIISAVVARVRYSVTTTPTFSATMRGVAPYGKTRHGAGGTWTFRAAIMKLMGDDRAVSVAVAEAIIGWGCMHIPHLRSRTCAKHCWEKDHCKMERLHGYLPLPNALPLSCGRPSAADRQSAKGS
jgi:hypothetical protein